MVMVVATNCKASMSTTNEPILRSLPRVFATALFFILVLSADGAAQSSQYCAGFIEGWKSIKGVYSQAPTCPLAPMTPAGSTPLREGIAAGQRAARASSGTSSASTYQRSSQQDFCEGFAEGWKARKGGSIVPVCPVAPVTPVGSTAYREGIRRGMAVAEREGGSSVGLGMSGSQHDPRAFCDGFAIGWKSIKGDLAIVPICPIPPVTPVGGTAYGEGLKAGVARARKG